MAYCRELKFEEKPQYNHLRRIFKDLFNRMGYEFDYVYDWNLLGKNDKVKKKIQGVSQGPRPQTGKAEGNGLGLGQSQYQS